jgi:hypothetical protein
MNYTKQFLNKLNLTFIYVLFLSFSLHAQNLLNGPNDIVFESSNNRYLVANWAGNSIVVIDSLGNQSYFLNNVTHAHGMEIKDTILYVASHHNLLLIDLISASIIKNIYVPESEYLGHIAVDSSHFVYITDWSAKKLFKINSNDQTSITLYTFNATPVGISYQENNNRLIILTLVNNAPILAYNLTNGIIDTVRNTNINNPDAICRDVNGNYYVTSFTENIVYRFGNDFSSGPEIISTGHGGPSGIGYNMPHNIIGVTNYNFNSIDLIQLAPGGIEIEFEENIEIRDDYILFQNYPNPFNPSTTISYQLPGLDNVGLTIYNLLGQEVRKLISEVQHPGQHTVQWDGRDSSGKTVPGGIYLYRIKVGRFIETKKMLLLR